jgi:hypothetical protein
VREVSSTLGCRTSSCQGLLGVHVEGDATDHESEAYNDEPVSGVWRNRDETIPGERPRNRWNPNEIPASRLACAIQRRSPHRRFYRIRTQPISRRCTGDLTTEQPAGTPGDDLQSPDLSHGATHEFGLLEQLPPPYRQVVSLVR